MKQELKTIDYEWLTRPTGDPFADLGGRVIQYLSEREPEKDILELIEYVARIYVSRWEAKLYQFFLNHPVTQPANKGEVKFTETVKYYQGLLDNREAEMGCCRISGRDTWVFKAGRNNSLMSGSGTFVNFHHSFQEGIMLSKEVIIRMFFVPFGAISVGGKIALIQANKPEISDFFVKLNCEKNLAAIAMNASGEVLKSEFGSISNALFEFVNNVFSNQIYDVSDEPQSVNLTLYHFTNFGASPEINIFRLPANVFRFYSLCQRPQFKADWNRFVFAYYRHSKFKGAVYNEGSGAYELVKKKETELVRMEDYRLWRNWVLENLLNQKSLLPFFLRWGTKHAFNIRIVELYQIHIQNMKQETLDKIKELSRFLADNNDENVIKKHIKALNGFKSAYDLRRFFLKVIVVKNYKQGNQDPILTVDEVVSYLFPDTNSWRDVRDLLLIAIFQDLHALNKKVDVDIDTEEDNKID